MSCWILLFDSVDGVMEFLNDTGLTEVFSTAEDKESGGLCIWYRDRVRTLMPVKIEVVM